MELNLSHVEEPSMQHMHDEEMALFSRLFELLESGDPGVGEIDACLAELDEHTQVHFAHEEDLMRKVNFPPYPAHAAEHKMALEKLQAIRLQWQQSQDAMQLKTQLEQDYLVWLKRHVSTMDDLTAQYYNRLKC